MPLISALAAPGSPRCFRLRIAHRCCFFTWSSASLASLDFLRCQTTCFSPVQDRSGESPASIQPWRRLYNSSHRRVAGCARTRIRHYSTRHVPPRDYTDTSATTLGTEGVALDLVSQAWEDEMPNGSGLRFQRSRRSLKAERWSQPALVLESIQDQARDMYSTRPSSKTDLSYKGIRPTKPGNPSWKANGRSSDYEAATRDAPITLYTILARHLANVTSSTWAGTKPEMNRQETDLLRSEGYNAKSVEIWTSCLLGTESVLASTSFRTGQQIPPLFIVLLFLRRKYIKVHALGIVMRHVNRRLRKEHISWASLKILVVRLLRHARVLWPESIPWIAALYTTEAARIYHEARKRRKLPTKLLSDITDFSNSMLSLLSLPTSLRPIISSHQQEEAQFNVLQFMNDCDPALPVSRFGFRAVTQNQLAHSKTAQEREWAGLKGPSWPPWKESRDAMDEEKGYGFGSSRASRILHGMFEAGYEGGIWEEIAEIYAGWNTDLSPTIQTRTTLPRAQRYSWNQDKLNSLRWAARIRTTRTRREAWACFLAHEASGDPVSSEEYFAMFEKLYHREVPQRENAAPIGSSVLGQHSIDRLSPGDMKEPMSDPQSPLHLVYLSEPVPSYLQLHHRMITKNIRPSIRLIAFHLKTSPDFSLVLRSLNSTPVFEKEWDLLLRGSHSTELKQLSLPDNLLGSFICFLCSWGRFWQPPSADPIAIPTKDALRLEPDKPYLLDYAFALLVEFRPAYRPAWTTYMKKVLFDPFDPSIGGGGTKIRPVAQYKILCRIMEEMNQVDLDPDDDQLRLLCTSARYAAQAAFRGDMPEEDARHILTTAPRLLRTTFHSLASAGMGPDHSTTDNAQIFIPPHIPDPSALHAYVRALGILRDYEGLYSLSTWATMYHKEVTARAATQRSASQGLFRTLVCLRAALEGTLEPGQQGASEELVQLVRAQIESVDNWEWPTDSHVRQYVELHMRVSTPI